MSDDPDEVRCLACDRVLASPLSRALGRGPVCQAGIDHIARRSHRRRTAPVGQLALDFPEED
jgi:hypothetical protein